MLYDGKDGEFDIKLFQNPTAQYRAAPFWSWNCKLDKNLLTEQIEILKEMGFGGFNMHSRSGMATKYLGDEFMQRIEDCCRKAESENMLAWLYDEDRWPSGLAGGYVTEDKRYRQRVLCFSEKAARFMPKADALKNGGAYLLAVYDIELDKNGFLKSYRTIGESDCALGIKRYAYVKPADEHTMFNGQTYLDTLSKDAVKKFIEVTHEKYKEKIGKYFGKTVPAIFTDEPQFAFIQNLPSSDSGADVNIAWTADFDKTYEERYAEIITEKLPEIFWDLPGGKISRTRYRYHEHSCERFTEAYAKQCGKWCSANNIAFSGHMLGESNLASQTRVIGEAMRAYKYFEIPGVDILYDNVELSTVKQVQSAAHQYGKKAVLSELYGATGWDFDFRSHKFQGDWQAALGITVRVPHLSWLSMKGQAKRDYPASINYQSPWYKEYKYVENHFARLNTVLTRGKPIVKLAVIHPIETLWVHLGPDDTSLDKRDDIDSGFLELTRYLSEGLIDFDFVSESLLPEQYRESDKKLIVGEMEYDTVLVPRCEMLRKTTVDILRRFQESGGKTVFVGKCPEYVDAEESKGVCGIYENSVKVDFNKNGILAALSDERNIEILKDGNRTERYVHTMREDGKFRWLFIAHSSRNPDLCTDDIATFDDAVIAVKGEYIPKLFNTVDAAIEDIDYETKDGKTYIYKKIYDFDSLLIRLEPGEGRYRSHCTEKQCLQTVDLNRCVSFERSEDNVLVLDFMSYSLDGVDWFSADEMRRIDKSCRRILNIPPSDGCSIQPWVIGENDGAHSVFLRCTVFSNFEADDVFIAGEEAESIAVNGENISLNPCGFYADRAISKYPMGKIKKGVNTIEIKSRISRTISLENYFILGDFDVKLRGCSAEICAPRRKIGFSDVTSQGMPFYGGNIRYRAAVDVAEISDVTVRVSRYRGALVKVYMDGLPLGIIAYPPYTLTAENVCPGGHVFEFELFGTRINTFGALHNCGDNHSSEPRTWETEGYGFSYEYVLKPVGIISAPVIEIRSR